MAFRNWNLEWLNLNAQRAYPLTADATGTDIQAAFKLPDDFIVGLYLPIHAGVNVQPGRFFIRSIGVYASGYSVVVGYAGDDGDINVATALIARETFTPNQSYALGGLGEFSDSFGRIVIGSLTGIDAQPAGQFTFNLTGTRLETDAVRPMIRGVSSLQVQNGTALSERYYGRVILQAGRNMRITSIPSDGDSAPTIIFDAIEGAGLTEQCACLGEAAGSPIYTINGIPPDETGNFSLLGDDCLQVSEIVNGVQLNDRCSKPCCGCPELEVVTTALKELSTKANTLQNHLQRLDTQLGAMTLLIGNL